MDKRRQFEELSREMLGLMNDTTADSELFFPFGYKLDTNIEEKYFPKGNNLRAITSRQMIVVDNSFKKFKLFPSYDIMITYVETQKDLLKDWKHLITAEFKKQNPNIKEKELSEFSGIVKKIINDINAFSKPAIKEVAESDEAKSPDINPEGIKNNVMDFLNSTFAGFFK